MRSDRTISDAQSIEDLMRAMAEDRRISLGLHGPGKHLLLACDLRADDLRLDDLATVLGNFVDALAAWRRIVAGVPKHCR